MCNGICSRHPKRSKKRILAINFDILKDAICRRCECYYKDIEGAFCPCCGYRFSRRIHKLKTAKKRAGILTKKVGNTFRDFWNMIIHVYRKRKGRGRLKGETFIRTKKKDMSNRTCLLCNSPTTYVQKKTGTPQWLRYMHGFICLKCHMREKRRNQYFANCPLGTHLTDAKFRVFRA